MSTGGSPPLLLPPATFPRQVCRPWRRYPRRPHNPMCCWCHSRASQVSLWCMWTVMLVCQHPTAGRNLLWGCSPAQEPHTVQVCLRDCPGTEQKESPKYRPKVYIASGTSESESWMEEPLHSDPENRAASQGKSAHF